MSTLNQNDATPQFKTAEYACQPSTDQCHFCGQAIVGQYFRASSQMACGSCADRLRRRTPEPGGRTFLRATLLGLCAALAGLVFYAAFGIITGWMIGYISFAVGWLVAKAMMKGSGGVGGRRYQVVAVLLTYMAVSMAAIPIYIAQARKEQTQIKHAQVQKAPEVSSEAQSAQTPPADGPATGSQPEAKHMNFATAVILALVGLASPFLALTSPLQGLIGLVILFAGLQIAWKNTAGGLTVEVDGPFELTPPASV